MTVISRVMKRCKKDGVSVTFRLGCMYIASKLRKRDRNQMYYDWISEYEKDIMQISPLKYNPRFSILVPVYNVKKEMLIECIESVKNQTYTNWQLCLVDDCSTMSEVKETLEEYKNVEGIVIKYREKNGHISRTTNDALELADGDFIGLLDCDDILAPNALYEMAKKLNEKEYDFIYSDEDMITEDGKRRYNPVFKTEWAPDTFMSVMYTNHFSVFRRSIAEEIGGYRVGYEGSQDYDFVLRFTEKTKHIGHIGKILYHWRARAESVASKPETKMYAYEAAMKAKRDALERRGLEGEVEYQSYIYQSRVFYKLKKKDTISIIIPSKDNVAYITRVLDSILDKTTYKNFEVVVVDNGSKEENKKQYDEICDKYGCNYVYRPMEFNFSKMCNIGASRSTGRFLLFLNDDMELINGDWLERLAGQAALEHAGAVGAKLYYPEEMRLQHIGIVNRVEGPSHYYCGGREITSDYKMQMDVNYCAVTGACLMIERKKYDEIGGFNEELPIAYNDVDLCFKLVEKGYYNVVRNDVKLFHYESVSRGSDMIDSAKMKRLQQEKKSLYAMHPYFDGYDPYYSENMKLISNMEGLGGLKHRTPVKMNKLSKQMVDCNDEAVSFFMNIGMFEHLQIIKFEGWFFWRNFLFNNENKVSVILKSETGIYKVNTQKLYHVPVGDGEYKGNCKLSGYIVAANVDSIPRGKYDVFLEVRKWKLFGKSIIKTDKTVSI